MDPRSADAILFAPPMTYDVLVIGSGPNGLVAAITLAQAGRSVRVVEAAATPGGGMRTHALTLPDVRHDVCSTVHPLALASPAFRSLPLTSHGLEWVHPETALAHPLDGARAAGGLRRAFPGEPNRAAAPLG